MRLHRSKTVDVQDLAFFLHATSWKSCALHALASYLITDGHLSSVITGGEQARLFSTMTRGSECKTINEILAQVEQTVNVRASMLSHTDNEYRDVSLFTKKMTSHSLRHGATTTNRNQPGIANEDIAMRGNWTLPGRINDYTGWSSVKDSYVIRTLCEWPSIHEGGLIPTMWNTLERSEEREIFRTFTGLLLGPVVSKLLSSEELGYTLVIVLIMHYKALREEYPESIVLKQMLRYPEICSDAALSQWCELFLKEYRRINASALPLDQLDSTESINIRCATALTDKMLQCAAIATNALIQFPQLSERLNQANQKSDELHKSMLSLVQVQQVQQQLLQNQQDQLNVLLARVGST